MSDEVRRNYRRSLVRTVLLGLHEPTGDASCDRADRRNGVGAAMDLLDYIETLEATVERDRIRLMSADAEAARLRTAQSIVDVEVSP